MNWLPLAIFAPAVYAVVVFIDKYILEKEITDYRGMPVYSAVIAGIFGIVIWVATGFPLLTLRDSLLIILTGILTVFGLASYFKALASDEASKVTILFQMTPVITLVLSFFVLGSMISLTQLIGFLLILFSTIGISIGKQVGKFKFSNIFLLILLTDFLWAAAFVLFKFVINANSFTNVISYESWGMGIGGFILYNLFPSIRKAFNRTSRKVGKRIFWLIVVNESVFLISRLLTYLAISKGPVALVDVVGGLQVVFAIIYGLILTLVAPKIFKENISKKGLFKKLILAGFVLVGLWLVQR